MARSIMTPGDAWKWHKQTRPIRGCNYLPRTAINSIDMWQPDSFDLKTIDEELGWAEAAGFNSVRVFLHFLVWKNDSAAFCSRFDAFLKTASKHKIRCMPVLFCDCSFGQMEPYLGKQREPIPGVHNSGWVPSPGFARALDRSTWPELEHYVTDVIRTFAKDDRILAWDVYNEPGNSKMGEKSRPLLDASFAWARAADPSQPLTAGPWEFFEGGSHGLSNRMFELSDVISFHGYETRAEMLAKIRYCQTYQRPVICTEWLNRLAGNTFAEILPLFNEHDVGWYQWGFVAGKTQTYLPWGSKQGDPTPPVWQHDLLHPDGRPYDSKEMDLLKSCSGQN
jgi:hypothetical protein